MKKTPLYSRSRTPEPAAPGPGMAETRARSGETAATAVGDTPSPAAAAKPLTRRARLKAWLRRHERPVWATAVLALVVGATAFNASMLPRTPPLTIAQIDAAVRKSIEEKPLPSPESAAYEAILPSVVRVVGLMTEGDDGTDRNDGKSKPESKEAKDPKDAKPHAPFERGVGTGVVIIDNGTILTNLHVISGARRIKVTFMDGSESDAVVISTQPENDLAVLRARTIPDDLEAATMRSTADLAPGDHVLAVGFPFGIGPSASAGVVSGLKREFRSPEGKQTLTNLIQFDAAANPGNSGGPLVTMDGEVVGIVTAILNPSQQRTFIGIGFAVPIENAAAAAGMPPF
jgi:S1-C subfamily serine protease